jgi:hypothetical protein
MEALEKLKTGVEPLFLLFSDGFGEGEEREARGFVIDQ